MIRSQLRERKMNSIYFMTVIQIKTGVQTKAEHTDKTIGVSFNKKCIGFSIADTDVLRKRLELFTDYDYAVLENIHQQFNDDVGNSVSSEIWFKCQHGIWEVCDNPPKFNKMFLGFCSFALE